MTQASIHDLERLLSFTVNETLSPLQRGINTVIYKFAESGGSGSNRQFIEIAEVCKAQYKTICSKLVEDSLQFGNNEEISLNEILPVLQKYLTEFYNRIVAMVEAVFSGSTTPHISIRTNTPELYKDLQYLMNHYDQDAQKGYLNGKKIYTIIDRPVVKKPQDPSVVNFQNLLHPKVIATSLHHYEDGNYRNAVLDAIVGVFDLIRDKTGLRGIDGEDLIGKVFSVKNPMLIIADIGDESGKNEHAGFMQMLQGAYKGIRNPKSHSLAHDLNGVSAGQYLVFISLLARRIDEAELKIVTETLPATADV